MTIGEWLATRKPEPPPRLLERIRAVLAESLDRDIAEFPGLALEGALTLLRGLMREPQHRDDAVDLLAADALVTYAFEAAAVDADALDARAEDAMRRISELLPGVRS